MNSKKIPGTILSLILVTLLLCLTAEAGEKSNINDKTKPYYDSLNSGVLLARSHGDADLSCKDCHDDFAKPLEKGSFGNDFCLRCHDIEDVDKEVVYKSRGEDVHPHDEHVGDIGCADCHSMHSNSTLKCAECHIQPWMKTLPARWEQPRLHNLKG